MTLDGNRTRDFVLVPAVITLAITLLRLAGELLNWTPLLFSRKAGGGFAIVGIVWLVPILGFVFARRLLQHGAGAPPAGRVIGSALGAVALLFAVGGVAGGLLKLGPNALFPVLFVAHVLAAWIAYRAWPALGFPL